MARFTVDDRITMWFGTEDAPAPEGRLTEHDPAIVIGSTGEVAIRVRYRVGGGPWADLALRPIDTSVSVRYVGGRFEGLPPGAPVEYEVRLRRGSPVPEVRIGDRRAFEAPGSRNAVPQCGDFLAGVPRRDGLTWGSVAEPVSVPVDVFACLMRVALNPERQPAGWMVWRDLGSEVAVDLEASRFGLRTGYVICGLRLRCEELREPGELTVPFATGSRPTQPTDPDVAGPAGLVMTGELAARGPTLLVDAWGDVAVRACWAALIDTVRVTAAAAGTDEEDGPLLPGAVWTGNDEISVIPQARHAIDARRRFV